MLKLLNMKCGSICCFVCFYTNNRLGIWEIGAIGIGGLVPVIEWLLVLWLADRRQKRLNSN
ncbi:MAG TPA: hypothetical protein H9778_06960 [Candidatus Parabacteroides intestinavium]|nr:hypothetical protein [Candidatus Parabacteroides intestinavium]